MSQTWKQVTKSNGMSRFRLTHVCKSDAVSLLHYVLKSISSWRSAETLHKDLCYVWYSYVTPLCLNLQHLCDASMSLAMCTTPTTLGYWETVTSGNDTCKNSITGFHELHLQLQRYCQNRLPDACCHARSLIYCSYAPGVAGILDLNTAVVLCLVEVFQESGEHNPTNLVILVLVRST